MEGCVSIFTRSNAHDTTVNALQVFCGYALSEPYQLMPRVIFYPLVWLAFWSRTALVVVILWTSVTAIHVISLATSHTSAALDLDMLPAYSQTVMGLCFAPAYITLSRGFQERWRTDVLAACLWMVLLWSAMVAYISTTRYQPTAMPCLDHHGHNISSHSLLSQCTFQCFNVTTTHPMRHGQPATLVAVPSSFWTGHGNTSSTVIWFTVCMVAFIILGIWMASKHSFIDYTRDKINQAKGKKAKQDEARMLVLAPKAAFFSFIILVWSSEDAFKHLPPHHEQKATINRWGLPVAFAVALLGLLLRRLARIVIYDPTDPDPNKTAFQKRQNAAAMGLVRPHDVELGDVNAAAPPQPARAHMAADGRRSAGEEGTAGGASDR